MVEGVKGVKEFFGGLCAECLLHTLTNLSDEKHPTNSGN